MEGTLLRTLVFESSLKHAVYNKMYLKTHFLYYEYRNDFRNEKVRFIQKNI